MSNSRTFLYSPLLIVTLPTTVQPYIQCTCKYQYIVHIIYLCIYVYGVVCAIHNDGCIKSSVYMPIMLIISIALKLKHSKKSRAFICQAYLNKISSDHTLKFRKHIKLTTMILNNSKIHFSESSLSLFIIVLRIN